MSALDGLVVLTALPAIGRDLHAGVEGQAWVVTAYTLPYAALLLTGAALGARFGRRRMYMIGLTVFTLASAAAASVRSIDALIVMRVLQGSGEALVLPLNLPIVTAAVSAKRRGAAIGALGALEGVAIVAAPIVGGAITQNLSWQWIFWINVPVGVILVPLIRWALDEGRGTAVRLDLVGVALSAAGLFGVVAGLLLASPLAFAAGVLGLIAFVGWELRTPTPAFPIRLLRLPVFAMSNLAGLLMYAGLFGAIFLLLRYFQLTLGFSPLSTGLRILPWTGLVILIAPVVGALSDRIDARRIITVGLALQAIGLAALTAAVATGASYAWFLPGMVLCGAGMTAYIAPSGNLAMSAAPEQHRGPAAGALTTTRQLGLVLGIATLTVMSTTLSLSAALWTAVAVLVAATAAGALARDRRLVPLATR
ncbi:MFS transporter [Kutzneria sp. NPDC051319]|uniref:MFS transporter n=1 Tax=Kutzneria sp. NPDC051319 TaxID=3155047 RepID=UPI00341E3912